MLTAANLKDPESQPVFVVRRPDANAFVTPSGTMVIFSGLLEVADNEAMLAAVIGHEIGHVLAQHAAERVSQRLMVGVGIRLAVAMLASAKPKYAPIYVPVARVGLSLAAQYGVFLPFSREHESEADHIGMILMAKAGFDPNEAVTFWDRMASQSGPRPSEFFSTHPAPETRRNDLQRWVADVMPDFRRARTAPNEDLQTVALVPVFPGTRQWWNELNSIIDARVQGTVTENESDHLRQDLLRRTVDLSYVGLRDVPPAADPEFWDQVLRLQEARRAGRIAVWDVQAKITQMLEEKKLVADQGRSK
jgi:hypothetical protein